MSIMLALSTSITNQLGGGTTPVFTFYVDPAGSDSNDGLSQVTPWQTVDKVNAATIPAGSTVLFKGGATFNGSLYLKEAQHSGTAGRITTFGSYGTGVATFNVVSSTEEGIWTQDVQYVLIKDFKLTGPGRTVSIYGGLDIAISKPSNARLQGLTIRNIEVSGFNNGIIGWGGASDGSSSGYDDLLIQNCLVHDCCANGNAIWLGTSAYGLLNKAATWLRPVIDGCKAYDNPGGYTSPVSHSGSGILLTGCDSAIVQYCEAYNNGAGNTYAAGPVGIWFYDCKNCIIQYCESHHNKTGVGTSDGGGFDIDGGCQGCIVQYCYSHDNYGPGYQLYQYSDAANILPMTGNRIRYNISENDGTQSPTTKGGLLIGTAETSRAASDNVVHNNTVFSSVASSNGFYLHSNPDKFTSSYFANNIIYLTGASTKVINSAPSAVPAVLCIGNCYSSPSTSIKWGATTYTTFSNWRTAFPTQETVAGAAVFKAANPTLVGTVPVGNINGFNSALLGAYKTQGASVCRNGGQNLNSLYGITVGSQDLYGNAIPQGLYDIGCFESA
ncbi:hypothetical protein RJJ92_24910 [Rhizobium redzepovicii]|nr:right-handed parallel beta-helix repeat-containing protein [Rhizobium redzepovicii]MDR9783866.1 hypothetical protein [Rhizobium redzepovicii]